MITRGHKKYLEGGVLPILIYPADLFIHFSGVNIECLLYAGPFARN